MGLENSLKKGVWLEGYLLIRSSHVSVVLAQEKNTNACCCHGSLVSPETLSTIEKRMKVHSALKSNTRHQHLPQTEQLPHLPVYNFGKVAKYTNLAFLDSVVLRLVNSS